MDSSRMELKKVYEEVIEDVINNVHEVFIAEGVEISVLEELKRIWMDKLVKSAVLPNEEKNLDTTEEASSSSSTENTKSPLKILLLAQPFLNQNGVWQIQLPVLSVNKQLGQIEKTDIDNNTINQIPQASTSEDLKTTNLLYIPKSIDQTDGNHDSSTESASEEETSEKDDLVVGDEQPLNSDDDVSQEEDDTFDTDNVIVCQYDKISRRFNKWKLYLKSGVMNLNGKDHVFKWFIGEAEW